MTKKKNEDDRRRSERKPHVVEAFLASPTATDDEEPHEVTSVNVSRHGVAFNYDQPLPEGAFFKIDISIGEQHIASEVRIISCRKIGEGNFEIGAEFC